MTIPEFKNSIILIHRFTLKMDRENIPMDIQRILIKDYANTLRINLTDSMIDDLINVCISMYSVSKYIKAYQN